MKMNDLTRYASNPATAVQFWSTHVDALDRHLSAGTWAMAGVTLMLMSYPIGRFLFPALVHQIMPIFHGMVPEVVRTVINWI
jgi:hypothetical protein